MLLLPRQQQKQIYVNVNTAGLCTVARTDGRKKARQASSFTMPRSSLVRTRSARVCVYVWSVNSTHTRLVVVWDLQKWLAIKVIMILRIQNQLHQEKF